MKEEHNDNIDIFSFKMKPKLVTPSDAQAPTGGTPQLPPMKSNKEQEDVSCY